MTSLKSFTLNGETIQLDDRIRSTVPGNFVHLPGGITRYELEGPPDGTPVVFINGFSIPAYLWDANFMPLASAGFRVLRFDHFGRGYSDRPDVNYDPDLFVQQLSDMLNALKITQPVHLIGSSMGGVVATIFTCRYPARVDKLVLIDPAGMMHVPAFPASALNMPILGKLILDLFGKKLLLPSMAKDLLHPEAFPEYTSRYAPQMKIKGFRRALHSTLRSGILYHHREDYVRLSQQERSILLLWGREDQTIPLSIGEQIKAILPGAVFQIIDQAGHVPHYELPEIVNPILIEFLSGGK